MILDDFSYYSWAFPLRNKSDTVAVIHRLFTYVTTQFRVPIQCMQCDNGGEFLTTSLRQLFSSHNAYSVSVAPTPSHKMAMPNKLSALLTTFFTSCSSMPNSLCNFVLRLYIQPNMCSIVPALIGNDAPTTKVVASYFSTGALFSSTRHISTS